jgi:hypothetical protein
MSLPAIGSLAVANYGGVQWSQPGGVGTQVFPAEQTGPFLAYPVQGVLWAENSGLWSFPYCLHWANLPLIMRSYDPNTQMSAALICCPMCSCIARIQEPYESIENPLLFPIVIP